MLHIPETKEDIFEWQNLYNKLVVIDKVEYAKAYAKLSPYIKNVLVQNKTILNRKSTAKYIVRMCTVRHNNGPNLVQAREIRAFILKHYAI